MNTKELLISLSSMNAVSGNERNIASALSELISTTIHTDQKCYMTGDSICFDYGIRTDKKPHVLIDAHVDQVGMISTYIDEEGFIVPGNIGGMDYRFFPAQKVFIHGLKDIPGVVTAIPPHLSDNTASACEINDIRIDTGYKKEDAEKLIPPGSTISFCCEPRTLMSGRLTGKSLDNRAGVAAVIKMLEILKNDKDLKKNIL